MENLGVCLLDQKNLSFSFSSCTSKLARLENVFTIFNESPHDPTLFSIHQQLRSEYIFLSFSQRGSGKWFQGVLCIYSGSTMACLLWILSCSIILLISVSNTILATMASTTFCLSHVSEISYFYYIYSCL